LDLIDCLAAVITGENTTLIDSIFLRDFLVRLSDSFCCWSRAVRGPECRSYFEIALAMRVAPHVGKSFDIATALAVGIVRTAGATVATHLVAPSLVGDSVKQLNE
jgi:hypothetical protein